jgi:hypothetical protein
MKKTILTSLMITLGLVGNLTSHAQKKDIYKDNKG